MQELGQAAPWHWDGERVVVTDAADTTRWGVKEQGNDAWGIIVHVPAGLLTPEQFGVLNDIIQTGGIWVKLTRRQQPILIIPREKVTAALDRLAKAGIKVSNLHGSVRNVVACPGKGFCPNARQDVMTLARRVGDTFYGVKLPWDFKIGFSGCSRNCTGTLCQCLGFLAEPRGTFTVYLGGSEAGSAPKQGTIIAQKIAPEKVLAVVGAVLREYVAQAARLAAAGEGEANWRLYQIIDKAGFAPFVQAIEAEVAK